MKNNRLNILIAAGLILMAAVARVVNFELHIYNFAPVAALGLFAGAVIKDKKYAFLLVLLAELLGDSYIALFTNWQGFYGGQIFVYGGMMLATWLGTTMGQPKAVKVLGYSIAGSVIFFLVSNFGVWLPIQMGRQDLFGYGKGFSGLVATYAAALPFFRNSLIGDLAGSVVLFGAYYLLQQAFIKKLQAAKS